MKWLFAEYIYIYIYIYIWVGGCAHLFIQMLYIYIDTHTFSTPVDTQKIDCQILWEELHMNSEKRQKHKAIEISGELNFWIISFNESWKQYLLNVKLNISTPILRIGLLYMVKECSILWGCYYGCTAHSIGQLVTYVLLMEEYF